MRTADILFLALFLVLTTTLVLSVWRLRGRARYLAATLLLTIGILAWTARSDESREVARLEEDLDRFCGDVEGMFGATAEFLRERPGYQLSHSLIERPPVRWVGAAGRLCIGLRDNCTETAVQANDATSASELERHLQTLADAFRTRTPCPERNP